ncbi:hypothetical protein FE257_000063 [Aspergillus nanangensis]|uniref:Uncharacterized protein n=1 Tax=Aspergillus nanangensis TaxID=2582783 RepID=A0AAD4CZ53_ASPNN|nr:hypothetical protein FE257_000063 [Aspergillus nanangensis]
MSSHRSRPPVPPPAAATRNQAGIESRKKCIGGIPCNCCRRANKACIIKDDSDGRLKGAMERRLEDLERDSGLLNRLLGSFRDDDKTEVNKVLNFIRSDMSLDEIRQFLAANTTPRGSSSAQQQVINAQSNVADFAHELRRKRKILIARAGEDSRAMAQSIDVALIGSFSLVPCLVSNSFKLQLILWDVSHSVQDSKGKQKTGSTGEISDDFHQHLEEWAIQLPECMSWETTPTPAILDLHMRYHSAIISVFEAATSSPDPNESTPTGRANGIQRSFSSSRAICSLLELYGSRWPMIYMPLNYIRYAEVALTNLLADLDNVESRVFFVNTFTSLQSLVSRLPVAKHFLRMIQEKAAKSCITVPGEIITLCE